jgi:hypothetical protein
LFVVVCGVLEVKCGSDGGSALTFCDVDSVPGEACSLPYQGAFLREERWDLSAHELIADRFVAVWVELVGIAHVPCP